MIFKILETALKFKIPTLVIVAFVILSGVWSWIDLRKEAYPDVGDTQVSIITKYIGRAAEEVEQSITLPIERALNGIPRVITRRSKTIAGLSVIQLIFEDGVDDYWARARVLEKLPDADLPDGVNAKIAPAWGPVNEIYRYVVISEADHTPMELRTAQDWIIMPRLLRAGGVIDVVNFGGLEKQFHVVTTPAKLTGYNLTVPQVIAAIQANNVNTGGNIVQRGEQGFIVRAIGAIHTKDDIRNIVVSTQNGVPVFVWQIGSVEEYPYPPAGFLGYYLNSEGKAPEISDMSVQGLVLMRRGAAVDETLRNVKEAIAELNTSGLPEGIKLRETYDRGDLVNYTIRTVGKTIFEGISIVTLILIFFVGSVRAALVVAATIPISVLFAFTMMKLTGINANLLSLGAIDFGIIVDGAVVMVENLMRNYRKHGNEWQSLNGLTINSAREVAREIFISISIIILAYLPIFTFQRVEGRLFSPMAFTLSFAVFASMLIALTAIPVLMNMLYTRYHEARTMHTIERHNPIYAWIEQRYAQIVEKLIRTSKRTVIAGFAFVALALVSGRLFIGTEFLPELDEGALNIRCFYPVGISISGARDLTKNVRDIIAKHPEVEIVITQLGRNDDGTDPYGPNRLEILVGLKDYSEWKRLRNKSQLVKILKSELEQNIPGAHFIFSQPIIDNVTEAVTGSVSDLAIMINGQDLAKMRDYAKQILEAVRQIPGASEVGIEQEGNQAQLNIEINRQAAARFGINVADVQAMIEAAIGAREIGKLRDGAMRFGIVVRYAAEFRSSIKAIQNLLITAPGGAKIPLMQIADIDFKDGPTIVQRFDSKRQISVRANIRGRDQGGFVADAQSVVRALNIPREYVITWGGQYENLARAGKRLQVVIPLTILCIFAILLYLYRDVRDVLVVMTCLPFSLAGGVIALLLRGYHFNVSSGVGFISLFGISVMSGVLFVSRVRHLHREEPRLTFREVILHSAVTQLRPRMMTILLALFGLVPAMLATGVGSDVQRPLATVIVGGLTSELILTLLVLPSAFIIWCKPFAAHDVPPAT
ncbi:MAG: efflux RND transporter permease subunit [Spirochaetes bacterium]|nr:efflux RND transporter permease subunit [Spirochaetota bacterium]